MLVLMRKIGEKIIINGNIEVSIISITGKQVKIGVEAPKNIAVHREEIQKIIEDKNIHKERKPTLLKNFRKLLE